MASKRLTPGGVREYLLEHHFTPTPHSLEAAPPGLIGVELETYPFQRKRNRLYPLEDLDPLFEVLRREDPSSVKIEAVDAISKKIFYTNQDSIQFEPGGQAELITGPVNTLAELSARIRSLKERVKEAGRELDIRFGQYGMQPWFKSSEIELRIRNERYQNLKAYLDRLSPFGGEMMLESSSLQINLDLGGIPQITAKRILLANLLAPFTTALFANSPMRAGHSKAYQSYRYFVWQHLDPLRSGTSYARNFTANTTLSDIADAYQQFALEAPVIPSYDPAKGPVPPVAFGVWLEKGIKDDYPDEEDLRNHMTLLFPDVRIRRSLEIRSLDVPPDGWEFVPICFYCGLLYDDASLEQALEILLSMRDSMEHISEQCVFGLQSDQLFKTGKVLFNIAMEGYERLPVDFKLKEDPTGGLEAYFDQFTLRRKTFANMQADLLG